MHINILECFLVLSNLFFLIAAIIYAYKKYYFVSLLYIGLTIASSEYHICFAPVHVITDRNYNFYNMCIIENSSVFGMSVMFVDILFANSCFIYTAVLSLPIFSKNSASLRYILANVCIVAIFFGGVIFGFFPDVNNPLSAVPEMANLLNENTIQKLKRYHSLDNIVKLIIVLSKLNKATYISTLSLVFLLGYFVFFFSLCLNQISVANHFTRSQKISIKIQIAYKELKSYYTKRFHLCFLIPCISCVFFALFIWVIIERMFKHEYEKTHGIWHTLSAASGILFGLSLKHDNSYFL